MLGSRGGFRGRGCRGCVPRPPEMTCGLSNTTCILYFSVTTSTGAYLRTIKNRSINKELSVRTSSGAVLFSDWLVRS